MLSGVVNGNSDKGFVLLVSKFYSYLKTYISLVCDQMQNDGKIR